MVVKICVLVTLCPADYMSGYSSRRTSCSSGGGGGGGGGGGNSGKKAITDNMKGGGRNILQAYFTVFQIPNMKEEI